MWAVLCARSDVALLPGILIATIQAGREDVLQRLCVEYGADLVSFNRGEEGVEAPGWEALMWCTYYGHAKMISMLPELTADPQILTRTDSKTGQSALHKLCLWTPQSSGCHILETILAITNFDPRSDPQKEAYVRGVLGFVPVPLLPPMQVGAD